MISQLSTLLMVLVITIWIGAITAGIEIKYKSPSFSCDTRQCLALQTWKSTQRLLYTFLSPVFTEQFSIGSPS